MKRLGIAIAVAAACAVRLFADDFSDEVGRALDKVLAREDTLIMVDVPLDAEKSGGGDGGSAFTAYLKETIEAKVTDLQKECFDMDANAQTEEILASLLDSGYVMDSGGAFASRSVPHGELSSVFTERNNMVQVSFVYKQFAGGSIRRTSFSISSKGLPGLAYSAEDTASLRKRLTGGMSENELADSRALCQIILSLETKKSALAKTYNNRIQQKQNALNAWYRVEYERRIKSAVKQPWETDIDFQEALEEEINALGKERKEKEAALMYDIAQDTGNLQILDVEEELGAYYAVLADSTFSIRVNNCRVLDFDTAAQCFPVQVSISSPQFSYTKLVTYPLSQPGEVLSRSERGERYTAFRNKTLVAQIVYRVLPDAAHAGVFVNEVDAVKLLDAADDSVVYEEAVHDRANSFLASSMSNSGIHTDVSVSAFPAGAIIQVDGAIKGKAPLVLTDLQEGERIIEAVWEDGVVKARRLRVFPGMIGTVEFTK